MVVAKKIWETIVGDDIREDLKEILEEIKPEFYEKKIIGKRLRDEVDDDDYDE